MAWSNVASILGLTGAVGTASVFFGTPIVALAVGVIIGIVLLIQSGMGDKLYDLTNDTLKTVGPILFVTAAHPAKYAAVRGTDQKIYPDVKRTSYAGSRAYEILFSSGLRKKRLSGRPCAGHDI